MNFCWKHLRDDVRRQNRSQIGQVCSLNVEFLNFPRSHATEPRVRAGRDRRQRETSTRSRRDMQPVRTPDDPRDYGTAHVMRVCIYHMHARALNTRVGSGGTRGGEGAQNTRSFHNATHSTGTSWPRSLPLFLLSFYSSLAPPIEITVHGCRDMGTVHRFPPSPFLSLSLCYRNRATFRDDEHSDERI